MSPAFDTLRTKLFLAIAGANVVLVMAAYLIYGWSFDQSLGEYLTRTEEDRLTPLVARLADGYRQHGGWTWLTEDRHLWSDMLREELGAGGRRRGDGRPPDSPEALPPLTMDPRLMLFDAEGAVLIGSPGRSTEAVRRPVTIDGRAVGYLGYIPRLRTVESLERVFSAQLGQRFGAIAVGMLLAVLVTAALISSWLSRRLSTLSAGAASLAQGEYSTRLRVDGDDELARLAGDFNHLALALEQTQRARRQWIADIAHELRTPLATLRAEIEALEDGVRPLSRTGVSSLAQEVGRLTRLVDDLQLLSLSDIGALTYRKEPLDLAESIDDGLNAYRDAIEGKRLTVALDLESGVRVLADVDRLAQVFGNLLQNTLRYTDSPGRLEIRLKTVGNEAEVRWEDSSPGVAADDLPRLTDRLYRVDGSRARTAGGSGLGLAIVKSIVEAHEGTLEASESPLGGLCWTLRFPRERGGDDSA